MKMKTFCLALTLLFVTTGGWGEELVITSDLTNGVVSTKWAEVTKLEIHLDAIPRNGDFELAPIPKKSGRPSLLLLTKTKPIAGKLLWFVVDGRKYSPSDTYGKATLEAVVSSKLDQLPSSRTKADSISVIQTIALASGEPGAILENETQTELILGRPIDDRPGAKLSSTLNKHLYLMFDVDKKSLLVRIRLSDYAYVARLNQWWGPSGDSVEKKNLTLFRALLTNEGRQQFDWGGWEYSSDHFNKIENKVKSNSIEPKDFMTDFATIQFTTLGIHFDDTEDWADFPSADIYTKGTALSKLYRELRRGTQQSEIVAPVGRDLAAHALKYLFGPEKTFARNANFDESALKSRLDAMYAQSTDTMLDLEMKPTGLQLKGPSTADFQFKTLAFQSVLPGTSGTPAVLFLPNSSNLVTSQTIVPGTLTNEQLWDSSSIVKIDTVSPQSVVRWSFLRPQKVKTLVFWAQSSFSIKSLSTDNPRSPNGYEVRYLRVGNGGVVEGTTSVGSGYQLITVTFKAEDQSVSTVELTLTSAVKLVKVASYPTKLTYNYTWSTTPDKTTVAVTKAEGYVLNEAQLITNPPQPLISFVSISGVSQPILPQGSDDISPIRYSFGGWETPSSYTTKLLKNATNGRSKKLPKGFPYTDFDAFPKQVRVSDAGLFTSPINLNSADGKKPADDYVSAYGYMTPFTHGTLLSPNSPFFAEKWAGVDSMGLLYSLILKHYSGSAFSINPDLD